MNLWNIKNLPVPPINTFKALDKSIDIKHLRNVFLEGKNFFDDQKYMDAEYAILSRIVYRSKQKFRSAKDFKALEKLQKALYNYFKTNISLDMQNFIELVPVRYKDETYLPDKNLLDYILVRLQGLAKLLERMVETCKITAGLFDGRISLGHFWKQGLLAFSLVSRIYILAKYSTKFICALYNKILPFSSKLKNTGRKWLPEDYILPTDLHQWMNVDWLEIDDELQIVETSVLHNVDIMEFLDLVDDEDIQYCGEYILVDDNGEGLNEYNSLRNVANIKQRIQAMRGFDAEDVGEVIEVKDDSLFIQENDEYVSDGLQEEIDDSVLVPNEESSKCNTSQVGICDNLMKKAVDIVEIDDSFEASGKQVSLQKDEVIVLDDSVAPYSKDIGEEFKDTDNSDVITILDESLSSGLDNKDFGTFFLDNKGELSTSKDKLSNKKKLKVVKAALNKSVHKIAKKQLPNSTGKVKSRRKIKKHEGRKNNSVKTDAQNAIVLLNPSRIGNEGKNMKKRKRKKVKNNVDVIENNKSLETNTIRVSSTNLSQKKILLANAVSKKKKKNNKTATASQSMLSVNNCNTKNTVLNKSSVVTNSKKKKKKAKAIGDGNQKIVQKGNSMPTQHQQVNGKKRKREMSADNVQKKKIHKSNAEVSLHKNKSVDGKKKKKKIKNLGEKNKVGLQNGKSTNAPHNHQDNKKRKKKISAQNLEQVKKLRKSGLWYGH